MMLLCFTEATEEEKVLPAVGRSHRPRHPHPHYCCFSKKMRLPSVVRATTLLHSDLWPNPLVSNSDPGNLCLCFCTPDSDMSFSRALQRVCCWGRSILVFRTSKFSLHGFQFDTIDSILKRNPAAVYLQPEGSIHASLLGFLLDHVARWIYGENTWRLWYFWKAWYS